MKITDIVVEQDLEEGPRLRSAALAALLGTGAVSGLTYAIAPEKSTTSQTQVQKKDDIGDLIKNLDQQPKTSIQEPKPSIQQNREAPAFVPAEHGQILVSTAKQMGLQGADLANFLAQCNVETSNWRRATESFAYTSPEVLRNTFTSRFPNLKVAAEYIERGPVAIANRALSGKNGNGNEASGDGWRFRGRGFIQLTGRELYARAGKALHPDNPNIYINKPDLLSSNPVESAKVAVWFYQTFVGTKQSAAKASMKVNPAGLKKDQRIQKSQYYYDVIKGKR